MLLKMTKIRMTKKGEFNYNQIVYARLLYLNRNNFNLRVTNSKKTLKFKIEPIKRY